MARKPTYRELEEKVKELEKESERRKRVEEALSKSEERYRRIAGAITDYIYTVNVENDRVKETIHGPGCITVTGYSPEEFERDPYLWFRMVHEEDRERVNDMATSVLTGQGTSSVEHRIYRKDGAIRWVVNTNVPRYDEAGKLISYDGLVQDITDRKRIEEELRKSEARLRLAMDSANAGIWEWDLLTNENFWSEELWKLYGLEPYSCVPSHEAWLQSILPDDQPAVEQAVQKAARNGWELNAHWRTRDQKGEERWLMSRGRPLSDVRGQLVRYIGIVIDITDRIKAEEALRESEELFRAIFNNAGVGIGIADKNRTFIMVNDRMAELIGTSKEELIGASNMDITAPEDKELSHKKLESLFKGEINLYRIEKRYIREDGSVFWVDLSVSPILDKDGNVKTSIGIFTDITKRKQAEEEKEKLKSQLHQAQKMEAIGNLAGGIAHDFNNILSPIMINAELVMMELPQDSPLHQNMQQIYRASERARDLVGQILTFARQRKNERIPIKISRILKEAVMMLRSALPTTIDIQYDVDTEQDMVLAEPTQIHQIIMNLCTNAAHAMEEKGGILEVILTNEKLDSKSAYLFHDLKPGPYLKLSVKDTGHGIEPHLLDKIFEPYFTTKKQDKGTGMGLAIVHGIVKSCGGEVTVQSEVNKGTTFSVYLPLVESDTKIMKMTKDSMKAPKGTERILLVDDEKSGIEAMQSTLEWFGYRVTPRTSSLEALEAFRNNPQEFDLIITDQTMPNMTGKELAKEVMTIHDGFPVIICTGFSEQIDERSAKEMGIRAFVMKPIVVKEIANTIREALDNK